MQTRNFFNDPKNVKKPSKPEGWTVSIKTLAEKIGATPNEITMILMRCGATGINKNSSISEKEARIIIDNFDEVF